VPALVLDGAQYKRSMTARANFLGILAA